MTRYFYSDLIEKFLDQSEEEVLGALNVAARMTVEYTQQQAWIAQVRILQAELVSFAGRGEIFFEYSVPRLGKRIDVVLLIDQVLFVVEFKVGDVIFASAAIEQVWDYALDLKNFHETSHGISIAPVLISTAARERMISPEFSTHGDGVLKPISISPKQLVAAIDQVLVVAVPVRMAPTEWQAGRYRPTPTIIEAATALYAGHSVQEISASGADRKNLAETSDAIIGIISKARAQSKKVICFVTGVPGAGKTLVGLNISTAKLAEADVANAVYLSGNGPLVNVLREALALDRVRSRAEQGEKLRKSEARRAVGSFIQNVHHFRDAYLNDMTAPHDHIAIFDEAQRAWNVEETARFMKAKRGRANFGMSEPEFLISCLDRHKDWAVIVCLVGGGQEINKGEAGIGEWIRAASTSFPDWEIHISGELTDTEYGAGAITQRLEGHPKVSSNSALHLSVSMRSFRAENVSGLVKSLLDIDADRAREHLREVRSKFPIVLTRSVSEGKAWVRSQARGSERYGMIVSSQAQRLKPHAIDVRVAVDPVQWFLKGKEDTRSSYYLEDVATEFDVQGLELDWTCVVWDGDLRRADTGWQHSSFKGSRWEKINKPERQAYLKNAYRVLLTRARQGMVIVVPTGDPDDLTRLPGLYDPTYEYLSSLGFAQI
jgi:hypothetical protein